MIIDFHAHIFPESICAQRKPCCETEPAFEMLYGPPSARLVGPSELMAAMDAGGVDRAVVFGFPWQSPELYRRHNDFVMEAVREFPGRLIGFGCFDPLAPGAAEEAERCLAGGLAGIGELAFYRSGIDDAALDALEPVMEVCRRRNLRSSLCNRKIFIVLTKCILMNFYQFRRWLHASCHHWQGNCTIFRQA